MLFMRSRDCFGNCVLNCEYLKSDLLNLNIKIWSLYFYRTETKSKTFCLTKIMFKPKSIMRLIEKKLERFLKVPSLFLNGSVHYPKNSSLVKIF
ncbi:hypothetical protein BpHYR1_045763 [Brachionus plicatilis]|uniref:Uncharacterized protein n=1 Tax=Brachionus plicatilis TaxID=10195 RepID=A0A3M7RDL8_BRAPC|nr:hypothetical protein BpHYR1_045763 [Brachionus plicatilis]